MMSYNSKANKKEAGFPASFLYRVLIFTVLKVVLVYY